MSAPMDRARIERLEADLALRFTSGNSVPVERAHITAADYDTIRALLRLARAVADAPRVMMWESWQDTLETDALPADAYRSLIGKTVFLLRADAADTTAGDAEPEGRG